MTALPQSVPASLSLPLFSPALLLAGFDKLMTGGGGGRFFRVA